MSNQEKYIHSKRILITCFFLCLLHTLCYANTKVDGFNRSTNKADSVNTLVNLSTEYRNINIDSALYFAKLSSKHTELGLQSFDKGDFVSALDHFFISLRICEKTNDQQKIAQLYNNISAIYNNTEKYNLAETYAKKAILINKKLGNKKELANALNSLGNVYYMEMKDSLCLDCYKESIKYRLMINDSVGLFSQYKNIGALYYEIGDTTKAIQNLEKSILFLKVIDDKAEWFSSYLTFAELYIYSGNLSKGKTYLDSCRLLLSEVKSIQMIDDYYYANYMYYKKLKNFEFALANYVNYINYKDSVENIEKHQQISEIETKYQTEKKEAENKQLKIKNQLTSAEITAKTAQQKIMLISFISIIIIIILSTLFILYRRKIKTQKQLQKEEKLRFKAVIKAEEKERIRIAKDLHDGLGQLLSTAKLNVASLEGNVEKEDEFLVKNACDLIDNAVKEVRNISHNMMPVALTQLGLVSAVEELISKMNHSGLLTVKFKVENLEYRLNSSIEIALYRVIQEILNNIIKHAQAQEVFIYLKKEKERLTLEISDNGVGFNTDEIDKSEGIGWKNIFSRIAMLNGNINVKSIKEKGTNLLVSIPINE